MRTLLLLIAAIFVGDGARADSRLTETENRWVAAAAPVIGFAQTQKLPLDIIVLPQAQAGDSPLALGLRDGRCKLVLAMRGNPAVANTEAAIPAGLFDVVVEAMAAHELAHCWRHVQGAWATLPGGAAEIAGAPDSQAVGETAEMAAMAQSMREARREEGFADLVALAWTWRQHPELYLQVHAWLSRVRSDVSIPGEHHDTQAWVNLVRDPTVFGDRRGPFVQAQAPWVRGLAIHE